MTKKRCGCKHSGSGMAQDLASVFFKDMIKSGINKAIAGPGIKPLPKKGGSMSFHSMIQRERNKPQYKLPKTIMYNKAPTRGGFIFPNLDSLIPVGQTYRSFRDPTIPVGQISQISRRY